MKKIAKRVAQLMLVGVLGMALVACGSDTTKTENTGTTTQDTKAPEPTTKVVKYLGQDYELPAKTERIVITGAVEAMEDSVLLDVHPVGALTISGTYPPLFKSITDKAKPIGEKIEPNFEEILALKPDVILGSTKFKPEVLEQLKKIAPTIPYSHVSTDWEANMKLLGELSGKQKQADEEIAKYKKDLDAGKTAISAQVKDKKVLAIRLRTGKLYIYPEAVFFNPVLYGDLGMTAPNEVKAAKAQELISTEKFAEMNPDYVFIQFAADENKDTPKALEELQNNPIIKNINAFKNGKVFVNVVDPLLQGGTAYSKVEFLKAAVSNLSK